LNEPVAHLSYREKLLVDRINRDAINHRQTRKALHDLQTVTAGGQLGVLVQQKAQAIYARDKAVEAQKQADRGRALAVEERDALQHKYDLSENERVKNKQERDTARQERDEIKVQRNQAWMVGGQFKQRIEHLTRRYVSTLSRRRQGQR
jgi:hypothetical protein